MYARRSLTTDTVMLARHHAGAITRRQLLESGLGVHVITRLAAEGRLAPVTRGVYAIGPITWPTRAWAGILVAGPGSCLSGLAAAHTWGLSDPPDVIEVRTEAHPHDRGGYRFVRGAVEAVGPELPRTGIARTVITLASRAGSPDAAAHWITRGIAQRAPLDELVETARAIPNLRRRQEILAIVDELEPGIESVLEHRYVVRVERDHGLPRPERQALVGADRLDMLHREFGVVIELDGRIGHAAEGAFRDMRRDNRHAEHGLVTLRFGWDDVTRDPCGVAAQVASTLRTRGWRGVLRPCRRCALPFAG